MLELVAAHDPVWALVVYDPLTDRATAWAYPMRDEDQIRLLQLGIASVAQRIMQQRLREEQDVAEDEEWVLPPEYDEEPER